MKSNQKHHTSPKVSSSFGVLRSGREHGGRVAGLAPIQAKRNQTGLPDNLKAGIENLSGHSMDDVKVHYNSRQPATLQAHAYAQGTDIHVAPGQERHLPHEAWHVVQQKQGRVKPTRQMKNRVPVNDDKGLEKEADTMGNKAWAGSVLQPKETRDGTVQRMPVVQLFTPEDQHIGEYFRITYRQIRSVGVYQGANMEGYLFKMREGEELTVPYGNEDSIQPTWGEMSLPKPSVHSSGSLPYSSLVGKYDSWSSSEKFQQVQTPFGEVNVKHNRNAPYVTTNKTQYPDTNVRVDYGDMVRALRQQKVGDDVIAQLLLDAESSGFTDPEAIRAAAMMVAVVYLAEEWRKKGAAKIFRAILRAVVAGRITLDNIKTHFEYVSSAQEGREQAARISAVLSGKQKESILTGKDKLIKEYMSPGGTDMDSDDEERTKKDSEFVNGRSWMY